MKNCLAILLFFLFLSCKEESSVKENPITKDANEKQYDWHKGFLKPSHITPISLLDSLTLKTDDVPFFSLLNDFPDNWVKEEDVEKLILIVDSKEKCKCLMNPLSSHVPNGNSNLGGYAIWLIDSFRTKTKLDFGLYTCKENDSEKLREVKEWWKKRNNKSNH